MNAVQQAAAWVLATGLRLLLRLPDRVLVVLLAVADRAARVAGVDAAAELEDLRGILRDDPRASRSLRRMFLESPPGEIRALVRGALRHHVGAAPAAPPARLPGYGGRTAGPARPRMTVGVIAEEPDAAAWCAAYAALAGCAARRLAPDEPLPPGLAALELAAAPDTAERVALQAINAGIAVSMHHASIQSAKVLEGVLAAASAAGAPLRVLYPPFHYAPVRRVLQMLEAGDIGVPSSIRVRATLAGTGGRAAPRWPESDDYLGHPAFDHCLLLVLLGGPAARVCAYLNPITAAAGGQGLVHVAYRAPARCGALECSGAPQMYVRSDFHPHDLEAEVAGTDGLVFLQRGMAQRTREAPIVLRAGRTAAAIGVASGLPDSWDHVFAVAAAEHCATLRGGRSPAIGREDLLAAWRLRDAARRAARCAETLEV